MDGTEEWDKVRVTQLCPQGQWYGRWTGPGAKFVKECLFFLLLLGKWVLLSQWFSALACTLLSPGKLLKCCRLIPEFRVKWLGVQPDCRVENLPIRQRRSSWANWDTGEEGVWGWGCVREINKATRKTLGVAISTAQTRDPGRHWWQKQDRGLLSQRAAADVTCKTSDLQSGWKRFHQPEIPPWLQEVLTRLHGMEKCDCRYGLAFPIVGDKKQGLQEMVYCSSKHKVG